MDPIPPEAAPEPVAERATFTGDGREYFQIWIVNVALSIVTLGIYSAWAKVRRLQYFYRHTRLAGSSFDYHGDPIAIFKGRVVGAALFLAYTFAGLMHPIAAIATILGIALAMPFLLSRSLRFRAHNSSYRGIRFSFKGSTASAYWVFLGLPLLMVLSLFTLGPFWHQRMKRYQFDNARLGQARFTFGTTVGDFYVTYIAAGLIAVGVFGLLGALVAFGIGALAVTTGGASDPDFGTNPAAQAAAVTIGLVVFAIYFVGVVALQAFTAARLRNIVWNHTTLGSRRFVSTVRAGSLLWLMVTNLVATIATVGLFWPFAQVRLARYYAGTFEMVGPPAFDDVIAGDAGEEQAVGEEVAEFFDFDIAF